MHSSGGSRDLHLGLELVCSGGGVAVRGRVHGSGYFGFACSGEERRRTVRWFQRPHWEAGQRVVLLIQLP